PWLTQPRWGCDRNERPPRVVALLQPWALRRNPFGIQNFIMKDVGNNKGFSPLPRDPQRDAGVILEPLGEDPLKRRERRAPAAQGRRNVYRNSFGANSVR